MKKYSVNVHYRIVLPVQVEAETEEEAIRIAKESGEQMRSLNDYDFIETLDACVTDVESVDYGQEMIEAIRYVRKNIDMRDVNYTRDCVYRHHSCVRAENPDILSRIYDLMEEYGADNELPENWWLEEMDEEEIFEQL